MKVGQIVTKFSMSWGGGKVVRPGNVISEYMSSNSTPPIPGAI